MLNILISKTDPYSFMGLIKATRTGAHISAPLRSLIRAGLASLILMVAITQMAGGSAQARQVEDKPGTQLTMGTSLTTACRPEACKMV
ncbi:MAG: hypothetical protein COB54_02305 [Alphaproteobacteria bacterium]|nr:MAG: hypothetical protein COB54_02305 [Alphaproteobacteria bacterium]